MNKEFEERLKQLLLTLTPREEKVTKLWFFDGKTIKEIAKHFEVTEERVKAIREKAGRKINSRYRESFQIRYCPESISFVDLKNAN